MPHGNLAQALDGERNDLLGAELGAVQEALLRNIPIIGERQPKIGRPDFTWDWCPLGDWVSSFWCGSLWLGFDLSGDPAFELAARRQMPVFQELLRHRHLHDHDLGFLYSLSCVAGFRITGEQAYREWAIEAARSLAERYNSRGRFIVAWNARPEDPEDLARAKPGKIIIDCFENLALLLWASAETGDRRLGDIAIAHAETAMDVLVRADGSSAHTFDFDPETGRRIGPSTHQGFSDDSCWSRGQAWAIHGLSMVHLYTGHRGALEAAVKLADYAVARLPADHVPVWDFDLPAQAPQHRDSSAGSILAAGLLLLADQVDGQQAEGYRSAARKILAGLGQRCGLYRKPEAQGLLAEGAAFVAKGLRETMLPYGDYFFVEGLARATGHKRFGW